MDRLNRERKVYTVSEDMEELLSLVDERFRIHQNKLEDLKTYNFDYADGLREGEINGMVKIFTWISMLEKGRSI